MAPLLITMDPQWAFMDPLWAMEPLRAMDPLLVTTIGEEAHNRFPAFVCEQKKLPLRVGVPIAPLKCKRRHAYLLILR